jgi:hypothetical protein
MLSWLSKNRGEVLFLSAFAVVMTTDLRQPVLSTLQRGLLATGLWRATPPASPAALPVQFASLGADYPYPRPLGQPASV